MKVKGHYTMDKIRKIPSHRHFKRASIFAGVFAAIGTVSILSSFAATPTAHFEVELAALASGAQQVSDTTASSNQAIQFGEAPPHESTGCTPGTLSLHGPCVNNSLIPAPKAGASTVRIDNEAPITAANGGGEPAAFRQRCDFSHMNNDDSVLFPNRPGVAHLHAYFGNTAANNISTSASLRNSGNSTCAGGIFNRSAYWVPAMIDTTTGRPIAPNDDRSNYHSDLEIYYKLGYQGIGYTDVRPFPNGLQMIAGNTSSANSPTPNSKTKYWCENRTEPRVHLTAHLDYMPTCLAGQILTMSIDFPQCWDGVNLTSTNGRSHLTYGQWMANVDARYTHGCPVTHPVGIPNVHMFIRYAVPSGDTSRWRLASDNYTTGPGGYSGHADYIFAWDETAFPTVKERCYVAQLDCHYQLGDGREPRHPRF
ncbi:MAG: DUF1996 domain-containing protein [bacterium]|nr:DUF1996 domain-containing protein [bacterium]